MLPAMDEVVACKFCGRRQPVRAFVHPATNQALRGYDAAWLGEQLQELKKKYSKHGRPGHASYDARKAGLLMDASSKAATAGVDGQKGSFARAFVPDGVRPGDTIELKAGAMTVRVIVEHVESDRAGTTDGAK